MEAASDASISIGARSVPVCWLCGGSGTVLFRNLRDHLFGAPGTWNLRRCTDSACGLVWLDPVPREEDIGQAYRTYYTHGPGTVSSGVAAKIRLAVSSGYLHGSLGYAKGTGASWYRYLRFLAHLYPTGPGHIASEAMFLPAPSFPARLLDVGCGNGDLLVRMRSLRWDVEGVDVDPTAVHTARGRGLQVRQGDLRSLNYPPERFDAVTLNHVIEHVYDPPALLREAYRLLKPGGTLVVLTPNSQSLGTHLYGPDWRGWEPPRHLHIFNVASLRATLTKAGLTQVEVRTVARAARDIVSTSETLKRRRLALAEPSEPEAYRKTLKSMAWQFAERFLILVNGRVGEEILVVAHKSARS